MQDRNPRHLGKALPQRVYDLAHRARRWTVVRLVGHALHTIASFSMVAHHAEKRDDGPRLGHSDPRRRPVDRKRLVGERDPLSSLVGRLMHAGESMDQLIATLARLRRPRPRRNAPSLHFPADGARRPP